jgi:arabinose-5-phosphate isomerase
MNLDKEIIKVLTAEASAIFSVRLEIDSSVSDVVKLVFNATKNGNNIFLSGVGKCSYIAEKLAATYTSLGIPSFYLHCINALHGDVGVLRKGDILILLSKSGETEEMVELAQVSKTYEAVPVAVTCVGNSPLVGACKKSVVVPIKEEADALNLAPTSSTTVFLAVGDAIGVVTSKCLKFTVGAFRKGHKRGRLGKEF